VGLGRIVALSDAAPLDPTPENPAAPARLKRRDRSPAALAPLPFKAFDADLSPPPTSESGAVATATSLVSGSDQKNGTDAVDDSGTIIYGVDSAGVVPPAPIRQEIARELPSDVDPAQLARVDLVVGIDGNVESVRLIGEPRNVHESMFLSAIKAWQFRPATKDGLPVRFRKSIWIGPE
jgi:hypothetical protein